MQSVLVLQYLLVLVSAITLCFGSEVGASCETDLHRSYVASARSSSMQKRQNTPGTRNLLDRGDINHFNGEGYSFSIGIGNGVLDMGLDTMSGCTFIMSNCFIPNTSCEAKTQVNSINSSTYSTIETSYRTILDGYADTNGSLFTDVIDTILGDSFPLLKGLVMLAVESSDLQPANYLLDGDVGLGPVGCDGSPDGTLLDLMVSQGLISSRLYSLYIASSGTHGGSTSNDGDIIFGGVDPDLYDPGTLIALPMMPYPNTTDMSTPLVELGSISIATHGTTLVYPTDPMLTTFQASYDTNSVPDVIYQALVNLTGADPATYGLVDCSWRNSTTTLSFSFGSANETEIAMPLSNFVLYVLHEDMTPVEPPMCWLAFNNFTTGFAWLGTSFMQSAYLVFDYDNQEIAIAPIRSAVPKSLPQSVSVVNITAAQPNTLYSTVGSASSGSVHGTTAASASITTSGSSLLAASSVPSSTPPPSSSQQTTGASTTAELHSGSAPVINSINLASSTSIGGENSTAVSAATDSVGVMDAFRLSILTFSLVLALS